MILYRSVEHGACSNCIVVQKRGANLKLLCPSKSWPPAWQCWKILAAFYLDRKRYVESEKILLEVSRRSSEAFEDENLTTVGFQMLLALLYAAIELDIGGDKEETMCTPLVQ